jgi:ribose-phosphate pyrophosphokinase
LQFAAGAARAKGAVRVGLVAPYLAYMRQDAQFHDGEAVSALHYGRFLSSVFDWVATVDPHLHRMKSLSDAYSIPAECVSSMPAVSDWIAANVANPVLVGPDRESTQWAEKVAQRLGVPWTILEKTRSGDRDVSVSLPDPALLRGRSPVIVDDIVSSGRTLAEAANGLRSLGATSDHLCGGPRAVRIRRGSGDPGRRGDAPREHEHRGSFDQRSERGTSRGRAGARVGRQLTPRYRS